jgi:ribosomal protein S18 acetylase RimI-like enzyme
LSDSRRHPGTAADSRIAGPIRLRPELPEDATFLFRLYASTRADEMKLVPWNDAQKDEFLRMQFRAQSTHYHSFYPDASYEVILRAEEPVGRLYIHRSDDAIRLIDIALLPEHRRAGIGGQLLNEILSQATAQRKRVQIHVERENPAMRLYTRLGFQKIEDKGVYYFMEWTPGAPPA